MARRTKEDAEMTRNQLLDAAQTVFFSKGVAGASLADIAHAASLTRGAIYWHFKDKADLFDALMQRTTLPFEQAWHVGQQLARSNGHALAEICSVLRMVLRSVATDINTRQVFDIALYKLECVGEMADIRERRVQGALRFTAQMQEQLILAAQQAGVQLPMPAHSAARGLHAVFDGVLHAWLLHTEPPFDLECEGMTVVEHYLRGLGFEVSKEILGFFPKAVKTAG